MGLRAEDMHRWAEDWFEDEDGKQEFKLLLVLRMHWVCGIPEDVMDAEEGLKLGSVRHAGECDADYPDGPFYAT